MRGILLCDHCLLVRGKWYSATTVMSLDGIHDLYLTEGTINGGKFSRFVEDCLMPVLNSFNYINIHQYLRNC